MLSEKVEELRVLLTRARGKGLDTTAWEKRLAELFMQAPSAPRPMPAIPPSPEDPLAEAEKAAGIVVRDGYVLLWAETVQDYIAFVRDEGMASRVPPGFVIYTDAELRELFGKGQRHNPATLRFIHEAKKLGGTIANEG